MTKQEFLADLREGLSGLPQSDIEERIAFYSEMIDDRMEEGLSEQEAVAAVGSVNDIILQVVDEYPFPELIKVRIRSRKPMSTLTIVLLILGSPIWLSLLIAAFDGSSGGTRYTVEYALNRGLGIVDLPIPM